MSMNIKLPILVSQTSSCRPACLSDYYYCSFKWTDLSIKYCLCLKPNIFMWVHMLLSRMEEIHIGHCYIILFSSCFWQRFLSKQCLLHMRFIIFLLHKLLSGDLRLKWEIKAAQGSKYPVWALGKDPLCDFLTSHKKACCWSPSCIKYRVSGRASGIKHLCQTTCVNHWKLICYSEPWGDMLNGEQHV